VSSRIRYEKYDDPNSKWDMVSCRNFNSSSTDAMYIVYLNTETLQYTIKNMTTYREYGLPEGKKLTNLQVLKRNVKSRLQKLGVSFDSEIRDNTSRVAGVNCSYKKEK
jgi:hypothetical protein